MSFWRIHTIVVLLKKELKSVFFGWEFYSTVCIVFLVSSFVLKNIIAHVQSSGIRIGSDLLAFPYLVAVFVPMVYTSLSSVISVVKEKNEGTLEVLFFGPVGFISYLTGKYLKELLTYGGVVIFIVIYFFFVSYLTNLELSIQFVQIIIASFLLASCLISLGIFISTLSTGITKAILLFALIVLGFSGVQVLHQLLLNLSLVTGSTALGYFQESIGIISEVVGWVSPLFYFLRSYDAVYLQALGPYSLYLGLSAIYSFFFLFCARFMLKHKGVMPKE